MVRGSWFIIAALVTVTHSEIFQFQETKISDAKSLQVLHAFYIHAGSSTDHPFVEFQALSAHSTSNLKDYALGSYQGLQVGVLPHTRFSQWINPQKFCSTWQDAVKHEGKHGQLILNTQDVDASSYIHTVPFSTNQGSSAKTARVRLLETGIYLLFVSNCGSIQNVTINGSVVAMNPYGFLPGNESPKKAFYGWLALVYSFLAFLWLCLFVRWWTELIHFHYFIGAVAFIGLAEAILWYTYFKDWNQTGLVSSPLFTAALLFSVMKSVFAYMAALLVAQGWGVTQSSLECRILIKVQCLSVIYAICTIVQQSVLPILGLTTMSATFLISCLMPVAVVNGALFFWIFLGLSNLMRTLQELKETEKLLLFERLWSLIIVALAVASISKLCEMVDSSRNIDLRWNHQWIFSDGVSHTIFVLFLVVLSYLLAPSSNSKSYAYAPPTGEDDAVGGVKATNIWADDDDAEDEKGGSAATSPE